MIQHCARCGSRIATTSGFEEFPVACGTCGAIAEPRRDLADENDAEPCPGLLLLPDSLRQRSLSDEEILMRAEDALVAVDVLETAGALITYCDCMVGIDERMHYDPEFRGPGEGVENAGADWAARVSTAATTCRSCIHEHVARFRQTESGEHLYFGFMVELQRE